MRSIFKDPKRNKRYFQPVIFCSIFIVFSFAVFRGESLSAQETSGLQTKRKVFEHVILISIDGLRSDAIVNLGHLSAPNLHGLITNGVSTINARTDPDSTVTMPNHTSMLTGRGVMGKAGHNYTWNYTDKKNIHDVKREYVAGVFDVVHENGMSSAFFSAKDKFKLYAMSYGAKGAANAKSYQYNGKQLIDAYAVGNYNDYAIADIFFDVFRELKPNFVFLHFSGPDNVGHDFHWDVSGNSYYLREVRRKDELLGAIVRFVLDDPKLANSTAFIITSDHGGRYNDHFNINDPLDYTIPFIVWGKGLARGFEFYGLNPETRKNPFIEQIPYGPSGQPVRNGDAANLALYLLGLPPVPGSTINYQQDLNVYPPR